MISRPKPTAATRKRTRLSAEERRAQLLDVAGAVVARERRTAALTMERLADEGGVSKALVYLYFPTRKALLHAMIERELAHLDRAVRGQTALARTPEEKARAWVHAYFDTAGNRGNVLSTLLNEPSMEPEIERGRKRRREERLRRWSETAETELGIPARMGRPIADMMDGSLQRALAYWLASGEDRALLEELQVTAIIGTLRELGRREEALRRVIAGDRAAE